MIIINKDKVIKNNYERIFSLEEICKSNNLIINLKMWKENKKSLLSSKKNFAIELMPDCHIDDLICDINIFKLLILKFSSFKDGRPFTIANDLRTSFNYKNELRASGDVLPDQYIFLLRCGFDTVEIDSKLKKTWFRIYKNDNGMYYQKSRK